MRIKILRELEFQKNKYNENMKRVQRKITQYTEKKLVSKIEYSQI